LITDPPNVASGCKGLYTAKENNRLRGGLDYSSVTASYRLPSST